MNTKITYMYRDVNNYKQHAKVIVSGEVKREQLIECCSSLIGDDNDFLPEQVGLYGLQEQMCNGIQEDEDGVWHELLDVEPTDEEPDYPRTADELLANFQEAKDNWDEEAEMEAVGLMGCDDEDEDEEED